MNDLTISYLDQNHGQRVNQALKSLLMIGRTSTKPSACASPVITFTVGVIRPITTPAPRDPWNTEKMMGVFWALKLPKGDFVHELA